MKTVTPRSRARSRSSSRISITPGRVEAVGGLVEHQQLGLVEQRSGEGQPLEVAERQGAGASIRVGLEREPLDHPIDGRTFADPGQAPCDVEVLADGQLRIRRRGLDQVADPPPQVSRAPRATRLPNSSTWPAVGRIIPSSIRIVVDLPAPLSPRKA